MWWRSRRLNLVFGVWCLVFGIIIVMLMGFFTAESFAAVTYRIYYSANDGGPNWRILCAELLADKGEVYRQLAVDIGQVGSLDSAQAFSQSVIREEDGTYTMWYGGNDGSNWRILRATSFDGKNWVKEGVCLNLGARDAFDSVHLVYPYVIKDGNLYKIYYTAYDGKGHWRIGYAESSDGIIFKNRKVVLDVGGGSALDAEHVHTPIVLKQGGLYIMYYAGYGGSTPAWRILRATSIDGISWMKQGLVLDLGKPQDLDAQNLLPGSVIFEEGVFKMYYWAHGSNWRLLYAVSKNGIDWEKKGLALEPGPVRSLDWRGLAVPAVVKEIK